MRFTGRVLAMALAVSASTVFYAQAQNNKYTMAQAVTGLRGQLAPKRFGAVSWMPGGDFYVRTLATQNGQALMMVNAKTGTADTLTTLKSFNKDLFGNDALNYFPEVKWLDNNTAYIDAGNYFFKINRTANGWKPAKWSMLGEQAANAQVNGATGGIAYTKGNNLFYHNGTTEVQITHDKDTGIVNGQGVHRNEFGIDKGIFLSPKGSSIAFYRMDQSMVTKYPIINWNPLPATMHYTYYPFAGGKSHHVTLGVYNIKTGNTVFMNTGLPADQYLTCVTWSPDEKEIYIALLNRGQNELKLNAYDAVTGQLKRTLFTESDPKYVHPENPLHFIPGKPNEFLWFSDRSGYRHLYRYNTSGRLLNAVTKGNWQVTGIDGFNPAGNNVIVTTTAVSPMERHIYAAELNGSRLTRLDKAPGTHRATVSADGEYVIDNYSSDNTPPTTVILGTRDGKERKLFSAENTLANFDNGVVENVTLKADDGTPLYGKLMKPARLVPGKKYPVIVYLYNGPNVQLLSNSFPASGNLWYNYMVQQGYIVFVMDGRGSANRGMKFEHATYLHLGTVEMQDQMVGVNYLRSLPYVDAARMGIHGWSFGGFMTTSFMLRHPGVFKCGVAGGPVIDWRMYEVMYTERYMRTPQTNPDGYSEASLLTKAEQLKGKLLIIHGGQDSTVVWQQSMDFLNAAIKAGKQVDYFVYPQHEHNVLGTDRVHLMQKVTDYFNLYLKPGQ